MTSQIIYKNIDPDYPACLSQKMLSMLRETGFNGLAIADSFAKTGILKKFSEEECYGLAIKAGNDMILPNYRVHFKEAYEKMLQSYKKGVFTEDRLNEAVARVIEAQKKTLAPCDENTMDSDEMNECVMRIARDGICTVVDDEVSLKLPKNKKRLFVIVSENLYDIEESMREIPDSCRIENDNIEAIKDCIIKRFPDSVMVISQYPNAAQIENVSYKSTLVDEIVYLTYSQAGGYSGSGSFNEKLLALMNSTKEKISAVVHVGSPYALEEAPHIPRILFCFGGGIASIEYAMAALKGQIVPSGVLPLDIKLP